MRITKSRGDEETMRSINYPLWALDFQSSSHEDEGFPVEVGVACWPRPQADVTWWSSLIRPDKSWVKWSDLSQNYHGISRDQLERAPAVETVAELLGKHLRDSIVYCNGGSYDSYWATSLYRAARRYPTFILTSWEEVLQTLEPKTASAARLGARTDEPRRAGPAAAHLIRAIARATGHDPGLREVTTMVTPDFI